MAASIDDTRWIQELESALVSNCDLNTVRKISNMKPVPENLRSEVWKISLNVSSEKETSDWDEIYDLPEQNLIRQDCQSLVDRLGNDEEEKLSVICDLESVLTRFCKTTGYKYTKNNGWMEVLQPLIALNLSKYELYYCFHSFITTYIPRHCYKDGYPFHLFRLLLLYHDPEFCSFLDTKKITPDTYAVDWFKSLFSATCDLKVIQAMWDIYLQLADPFFLFYLSLVLLCNSKEQIMSMKEENKEALIETISSAPCALEADDIEDFCTLAQFYASRTPQSFNRDYHVLMFGSEECIYKDLPQALCLPVSVAELAVSNNLERHTVVRYFVVDCRPADQYNSGHLKTAFHLDASLMLQEPQAFNTAVQALFAAQKQAMDAGSVAGGEHLCFMGSGREEEDQYVHMVVASFLQKHLQYVSLARGGYAALHELLSKDLDNHLADHNPKLCIACNGSSAQLSTNGSDDDDISFLDKFNIKQVTMVFRTRAIDMKEKLVEYITNPQPVVERHVSSSDRLGKRYRGMAPVFSIDDEHEDVGGQGDLEADTQEEVSIQTWTKKAGVIGSFKCEEIKENGYLYPSYLIVTDSHLYLLREISHKKGCARIVARRPLVSIVKITSKKQHPELITFKYGISDGSGSFTITSVDRLVISKAGEATHLIKYQVMKLLDEQEMR